MGRTKKIVNRDIPVSESPSAAVTPVQEATPPAPAKEQPQASDAQKAPDPVTVTNNDLINSIFSSFASDGKDSQKNDAKKLVQRYLTQIIEKHPIASKYNIVLLYDEMQMIQSDADNIYTAVTKFVERKPILLILHSSGGYVGPAYLIGKLLHEYSGGELEIAVPRKAKSAATLLCCAADHIHMGSLSELGPIDPQIEGLPALGLKSAIQHIAELTAEYPHAISLLSKYMSETISPIHLGYYERVAESAVQYADRLLQPHTSTLRQTPEKIAKDLVYSYKDHGFVIDKQESQNIFGDQVVRHNTEEYQLGNALYQGLVFISRIAAVVDYTFYMIGSLVSEPGFVPKKKK